MHRSDLPAPSSRALGRWIALYAMLAIVFALIFPAARPARALGPIQVTILTDVSDSNDGKCSLREAIQAANTDTATNPNNGGECPAGSSGIPDLITFSTGGVITLSNWISVNSNIAILGPIAISGGDASQIFRVTPNGTLSLSTMTIQNGNGNGASGGAILIDQGTLNIAGVSFEGNKAPGDGGAINNSSGTLNIVAGNFVGNKADGKGGAIYTSGTGRSFTIAASNLNGNSAGQSGGAIYNVNSSGSSQISDVIFSGNLATGDENTGGGAIFNAQNGNLSILRSAFNGNLSPSGNGGALFNNLSATVVISDTSFNGNLAGTPPSTTRRGGAIYNQAGLTITRVTLLNNAVFGDGGAITNDRKGNLTITNTSFTANAASGQGGGLNNVNSAQGNPAGSTATIRNGTFSSNAAILNGGGGIFNGAGHTVSLVNTIVDNSDSVGGNCSGTITSLGHNLDSGTGCAFGQAGDLSSADPKLDIPFFNGGPLVSLLTQKVKPGSAAIDKGDGAICAAAPVGNLDQRSEMRPEDGDGNGTAVCDIGAFEGERLVAGYGSTPVQPGPIDFGNATINTPIDAGFVVFETGNKALDIGAAALSGANPGDFAMVGGLPASIADGAAAHDVTLRCTPKAIGLRQAILTFQTNDPNEPTVSYTLLCNGTAVPAAGFGSTPAAPGPLDLGAAVVGVEVAGSISVEETGSAQLQVNTPVLGGANPGDFSVAPNLALTIANGAAPQPILLKCKPTGYGIRTATLTVQTNDPNRPAVSFDLTCTGIDAPTPFLDLPGESLTYPTGASHGPYGVAVSPDGKNVYATDYGNDRLIVFTRNTSTGNITVLQTVINGAGGVSGVDGSYLVTVSPDGQNVYVTGSTTDTVVSFKRSSVDGTLTFLSKLTRNDPYGFCNPGCPFALDALDGAYQVAISPDGQYGYVSSILDNKVVVLYRATNGALYMNPLGGPVQIFSTAAADLSQAYGMAISSDGANLYLTGYASDTLLVLKRNAADGTLALAEVHKNGLAGVDGLDGVFRVAVSPDGGHVYTASFDGNAVTAFRRDPTNGKLTYLVAYKDGFGGLDGLGFSSSVTVSQDGTRVLATGYNDDAVAIFERDATTGLLAQSQVIKRDATTHLPALDGARDVAVSPDGRTVYATGFNDNQVVALHVANPRPRISSLRPGSAAAGSPAFTLYVDGANFMPDSQVKWNGADRPTTFVNTTLLKADIPVADILAPGVIPVTVVNPAPGGGTSNSAPFTITGPNQNPVPSIDLISPQAAPAGGSAFTLDVVGSNFLPASQVRWNGAALPTTFVSATRLQAQIPAAEIGQPGLAGVTVLNPGPGGGSSNAATFTIVAPGQNPVPSIAQLDPPSTTTGAAASAAITLRVVGANFTEDSQVRWNGANRPTTFVSAGELRATIIAADISGAGTASVTVLTPEPGGGESNVATFTVGAVGDNPVPALTSAAVTLNGNGSLTLTLNGSGFMGGATVQWNGANRPATLLGGTRMAITVTAADLADTPSVLTVVNPGPGGGASNDLLFSLRKVLVPLIRR